MPLLQDEPVVSIGSMQELLALAAGVKRQIADKWSTLAARMQSHGRNDLAVIFQRLSTASAAQLEAVEQHALFETGVKLEPSAHANLLESIFDDEGAGTAAVELLNPYRILAMAVRNEDRAFAFWSYLAADSASPEIRLAAEQFAREQLAQVATLRRERRLAFHAQRAAMPPGEPRWTLIALEENLASLLDEASKAQAAEKARQRAAELRAFPFEQTPLLRNVETGAPATLQPCAELLLECYLDLAERLRGQEERNRAQIYAGQLLELL